MTRTLAFFDRLIIFLLGLLLLAGGLIPAALYWDIPYVSEFVRGINRSLLTDVPGMNWYTVALVGTMIGAIILGLWMIMPNIRNRGFSNRFIGTAALDLGDTRVNVARVAQAACNHAERSEIVKQAKQSVAYVGDRPTATFTVTANPDYDLETVVSFVEAIDADFRDAVDTMDIDTVFKLHLDKVAA
ncbi:hypothetical protein [Corynebacterium sp. p3-SID1194]|uniref:hypothetical protein n=1 Tax=Corynebacterium sp. p3-SID1194 TaxID=2916105 RepID=UPI0021A86FF7|nr:hypothetical protein [Corynebacterium sp. p3-SID1194]MCT1449545.1 hypothetical protein [Corynebacterium sp. p3-SID1194]